MLTNLSKLCSPTLYSFVTNVAASPISASLNSALVNVCFWSAGIGSYSLLVIFSVIPPISCAKADSCNGKVNMSLTSFLGLLS